MRAILESKRRERGRLRLLPFDEKIAILERMRDRALAIAGSSLARAKRYPHGPARIPGAKP
jgi:hypothetical protein